jgi:hypothetical protein
MRQRPRRRLAGDSINGRKQGGKAEVDEIDAADTEHDISCRHDSLAEERVEHIKKAGILVRVEERDRRTPPAGRSHFCGSTKE